VRQIAAAGAILFASSLAWAAVPTVAVLPFKDLSGSRGAVGEAIRETVTCDLRDVPGLRVVERASLDRVLVEQSYRAQPDDFDAGSTVKVGKLVGATLLVVGAYQRAGDGVRLTARFISVETGEIVGTAKVDGAATELLALEDRVTAALLKSAGLARQAPRFIQRARPKVSYKTFELYGDAVAEPDEQKKHALLKLALDEDPRFVYAVRDLDALNQRMARYELDARSKLQARERLLLDQALDGKHVAAAERLRLGRELLDSLAAARRYHAQAKIAQQLYGASDAKVDFTEPAAFALFDAQQHLQELDLALQTGEKYLSAFPTGIHYRDVDGRMHEIADGRRKRASRRAEYEADLAEKRAGLASRPPSPAQKLEWDYAPCIAARWNSQLNELMLDACGAFALKYARDPSADAQDKVLAARFFVILALADQGDFAGARPLADKLLADTHHWDEELRKTMDAWPAD
jgi:TolB-like protein